MAAWHHYSEVALESSAAKTDQIIVELDPKIAENQSDAADIGVCDVLHEIYPDYCTYWHVIGVIRVESGTLEGTTFEMENALGEVSNFVVESASPHYHLMDGSVVHPNGEWNAADASGEEWIEVRPVAKRRHSVASWSDTNGDGWVGAGAPGRWLLLRLAMSKKPARCRCSWDVAAPSPTEVYSIASHRNTLLGVAVSS